MEQSQELEESRWPQTDDLDVPMSWVLALQEVKWLPRCRQTVCASDRCRTPGASEAPIRSGSILEFDVSFSTPE